MKNPKLVCDACQREYEHRPYDLTLREVDGVLLISERVMQDDLDLCGTACVLKMASEWMGAKAIERRAQVEELERKAAL